MKNLLSLQQKKLAVDLSRTLVLCPKCDIEMHQTTVLGIHIEKCPQCEGVFFDKGETETLFQRTIRFCRTWTIRRKISV